MQAILSLRVSTCSTVSRRALVGRQVIHDLFVIFLFFLLTLIYIYIKSSHSFVLFFFVWFLTSLHTLFKRILSLLLVLVLVYLLPPIHGASINGTLQPAIHANV